jgi:hypothetical protein
MPGVPNEHLPGRGMTDLTSRGRYQDDLASLRRGLRVSRSIEERLSLLEERTHSPFSLENVEVSTNYSIPGGGYHARCNTSGGNITVTLPPVTNLNGQMVSVIKITVDANTVTIVPSGSDVLIIPAGTDVLGASGDNITLIAVDYLGNRAWDYI